MHTERDWLDLERRGQGLSNFEEVNTGVSGYTMSPTRSTWVAASLSSSSHFPLTRYSKSMNPVALPPGRAKLSM